MDMVMKNCHFTKIFLRSVQYYSFLFLTHPVWISKDLSHGSQSLVKMHFFVGLLIMLCHRMFKEWRMRHDDYIRWAGKKGTIIYFKILSPHSSWRIEGKYGKKNRIVNVLDWRVWGKLGRITIVNDFHGRGEENCGKITSHYICMEGLRKISRKSRYTVHSPGSTHKTLKNYDSQCVPLGRLRKTTDESWYEVHSPRTAEEKYGRIVIVSTPSEIRTGYLLHAR